VLHRPRSEEKLKLSYKHTSALSVARISLIDGAAFPPLRSLPVHLIALLKSALHHLLSWKQSHDEIILDVFAGCQHVDVYVPVHCGSN
jgi:hypothetical protein